MIKEKKNQKYKIGKPKNVLLIIGSWKLNQRTNDLSCEKLHKAKNQKQFDFISNM